MIEKNDSIPILLVDDEEGIRKVLGLALSDMGYMLYTAENGEKAMEILRDIHPPIVLTDIKMPGLDGIDLLRIIKKESPDTEVIMITGHGDLDLAIKSLKFEATDFITKPINDISLEIALKRAHDKISMRNQIKSYTESLEELIKEKSKKLIEAERMAAVGQTVAGLSHTIKNIASGLKGGAFVLEKGIEKKDMEYLFKGWELISGNVDKIAELSLDLLNYAKASKIHYAECHPNQPAEEVIELMSGKAKKSGIHLQFEPEENMESFLFDHEGIHRCLLNLVANAIDACNSKLENCGEKKVTLKTKRSQGWGVEYRVEDNGCGMGKEVTDNIFRSFYTTKGTKGTGIGLMMTKNIVDKHQGEIFAKSIEGAGSTFIIRIPKK